MAFAHLEESPFRLETLNYIYTAYAEQVKKTSASIYIYLSGLNLANIRLGPLALAAALALSASACTAVPECDGLGGNGSLERVEDACPPKPEKTVG